eukprot:CAMPEP_0194494752 /NCGR_PEP_ID=MMETSP0253-20130528/12567_1 /TAXON_ID=2966 /ORGANISM="Noctiluca scintillans" /LENGTH=91 /DNA_ID=CAMNT_0039335915 /DNA_START=81 /DNA_END=356 /DNA_ORIENTATION=-
MAPGALLLILVLVCGLNVLVSQVLGQSPLQRNAGVVQLQESQESFAGGGGHYLRSPDDMRGQVEPDGVAQAVYNNNNNNTNNNIVPDALLA